MTIELADRLVAARTSDLVRAMVTDLSRHQKIDLWRVLGVEERVAIEALMVLQSQSPTSPTAALDGEFASGTIVTTLTGLLGVVKHVFKSVAKPFVVYHEEINRTICYEIDDLRLES